LTHRIVWLRPERRRRVGAAAPTEGSTVLQTASIIFCDRCEAGTARFERNWRAYVQPENDDLHVTVVCPECAERKFGEDEAAWSD
jgi:hypothetical protein